MQQKCTECRTLHVDNKTLKAAFNDGPVVFKIITMMMMMMIIILFIIFSSISQL